MFYNYLFTEYATHISLEARNLGLKTIRSVYLPEKQTEH